MPCFAVQSAYCWWTSSHARIARSAPAGSQAAAPTRPGLLRGPGGSVPGAPGAPAACPRALRRWRCALEDRPPPKGGGRRLRSSLLRGETIPSATQAREFLKAVACCSGEVRKNGGFVKADRCVVVP
mmetsp:Transcript_4838/g.14918  ORF Transcript_4838/g.14918 Transcript_4838/m.14918 type:complete len:127 (-) Transcript_4838:728-1108(-)